MKKYFYIIIFLTGTALVVPGIIFAASEDDIGTSTMQFLKIGLGPRALAMGEAFTAVADDASSIYWNPAGLMRMKNMQVITGYDTLIESIKYAHLLFGIPYDEEYAFGLGISNVRQPSLLTYDTDGNNLGSTKPQDISGLISIAKGGGAFSIGVTVKYVSSRIGSSFAQTVAGDVGMLWSFESVNFGIVGQHLGSKVKFEQTSAPLPTTVRAGIALHFLENNDLTVSSDILFPNDNIPIYAGGIEKVFEFQEDRYGSIRAGYNSRAKDIDGTIGVSAGLGFAFKQYGIDYAWVPYGDLGSSHRLSFSMLFGERAEKKVRSYRAKKRKNGKSHPNQKSKTMKPSRRRKHSLEP